MNQPQKNTTKNPKTKGIGLDLNDDVHKIFQGVPPQKFNSSPLSSPWWLEEDPASYWVVW